MLHARMDYQRIQDPKKLIPEDEPVFLIRAQDELGARTVRKWADMFEQAGGDPVIVASARAHAILMDAWPTKKRADVPPGTPIATMTEVEVTPDAPSIGKHLSDTAERIRR